VINIKEKVGEKEGGKELYRIQCGKKPHLVVH
jgi:hypothetical protein